MEMHTAIPNGLGHTRNNKLYSKSAHAEMLAWSPDGSQIPLVLHHTTELDSLFILGFNSRWFQFRALQRLHPFSFPTSQKRFCVISHSEIFILSGATPQPINTSISLYCLRQDGEVWPWSKYSHGDIDYAVDFQFDRKTIFGEVQSGLKDQIHV